MLEPEWTPVAKVAMRILHLLNHTQRLNGHVHAAVDLACAQTKLGLDVAVASSGGDFDSLLTAHGVDTIMTDFRRHPRSLPLALWHLYALTRKWQADVVHAHMMTSALLAWPVCKRLGTPLVTTVHNAFQKSSALMGVGTRVIAVSAAVASTMQRRGIPRSRIDVVLNGTIGSARFEGRPRAPAALSSPAIVFVGGQHPRKGLPDLFAAFAGVHNRNGATRLYIVGDGPYLGTYMDMVRSMPCADAVRFLGAQDNPFPFLAGADIFVLPSHADPAPLVIPEAREAGCAIIGTEVDGIPELLEYGKAGILVPPRNPAALSAALRSLVENTDNLRLWKERSRINLDYLRVERVARQTLDVYTAAIRRRHTDLAKPHQQ